MKKKILVIESDLFWSGLICEFIEIGGFEADDVDYFGDGWERARSGGYDLVLLDLNWALLKGIHPDGQMERLLGTPLILLADQTEINHYLSGCSEARELLAKPFTFMQLMLKVKAILTPVKNRRDAPAPALSLTGAGFRPRISRRETEFPAAENGL